MILTSTLYRNISIYSGRVIPRYLGEKDIPWLKLLFSEFERLIGKSIRELQVRLKEPFSFECPRHSKDLAIQYLTKKVVSKSKMPVEPVMVRSLIFEKAAQVNGTRDEIFAIIAKETGIPQALLKECLFADLPKERKITGFDFDGNFEKLLLEVNTFLAKGLLCRTSGIRIHFIGNAASLVRQAKRTGLICTAFPAQSASEQSSLEISGPLSLFKNTLYYGRTLSQLLSVLYWCHGFRAEARLVPRNDRNDHTCGQGLIIHFQTGDPVLPATPLPLYDSKLEARFSKDFQKIALDWDLIREPESFEAGGTLIFPDFRIQHRRDFNRYWILEIAGFWTPEYLRLKVTRLAEAKITNLIVAINERKNCGSEPISKILEKGVKIISFSRFLDAKRVLNIVERY